VIFLVSGNSNSLDHSIADEKHELNIDCSMNLNNDLVTCIDPEGSI